MPYQNNGEFQQVHVSTNGMTLFSGDLMLKVNLYDQNLSLGFTPALTDSATGKRKFPKENTTNVLMTAERVQALYDIMTHRMVSAIEEHRTMNACITCNRDGSTMIGVTVSPEGIVSLMAYSGINEKRIPNKIHKFDFQDITPILNFNPESGDFAADETPIRAQLFLFVKMLEGFLLECNGASNHFGKYTDRFSDRRFMTSIDAMATKMGVTTAKGPSFNNTVPGTTVAPGGSFSASNTTSMNGVPSEMTDLNSMFGNSEVPF